MGVRTVGQGELVPRVIIGCVRNALARRHEFRYYFVRDLWIAAKRFAAGGIRNVELHQIQGLPDTPMTGFYDDANRLVLAAICHRLGARTFFEFGTNQGRTAWTVARNNPAMTVLTLDLPNLAAASHVHLELTDRRLFQEWNRGDAFAGTPEVDRIEMLFGDSATFDYSPFEGAIDVVYIDGSHSYSYVKNDTEAALRMLSPGGAIVWDDFPGYAGIYAYLEEFAARLHVLLLHIRGTRLVVYSRQPLIADLPADNVPVSPASV